MIPDDVAEETLLEYQVTICPCPFCSDGGNPEIHHLVKLESYGVRCSECKTIGPQVDSNYYAEHIHSQMGENSNDPETIAFVCKQASLSMWNERFMLH